MILKNQDCAYLIRGMPDDVNGTCYRSGSKGWMDRRIFVEWLNEQRANPRDMYGRTKEYLWIIVVDIMKPRKVKRL